jgi:ubiquinone/menaquinone biosynthesis C-methylase UbiE
MGCDNRHENQNNQDVHDMSDYVTALSLGNRLIEPAIRSAIQGLHLRPGSRGLDAGCGIGSHTSWLAEAVSPDGHVTGVDISPELLIHAEEIASKGGLRKQVSFQRGDLNKLPFGDDSFDWAWSKDTLWPGPKEMGCPAEDPLPLLNELARVVKPGGIVAVLFWSSQRLLPGYPLLEARLNATYAANAPWGEGMKPRLHFLRTLGWLREANLAECRAHTFVCDVQAPLDQATQKALLIMFRMFWGNAAAEVPPEDWAEFQRLCQPDSPDFILNTPDYYAFVTYSLFHGKVPK